MGILSFLFNKKQPTNSDLLNAGLRFAMEWGKDFRQPIHARMKKKFKFLSKEQLDSFDAVCREAMYEGLGFLDKTANQLYDSNQTMSAVELKRQLDFLMRSKYEWVSDENLNSLFHQGQYYIWHEGMSNCIN